MKTGRKELDVVPRTHRHEERAATRSGKQPTFVAAMAQVITAGGNDPRRRRDGKLTSGIDRSAPTLRAPGPTFEMVWTS